MKKFIFSARFFIWLLLVPVVASGQGAESFPNYVVIGAFAYHENAVHFTADARQQRFPAQFEMNPNRNLYYVYVLTTQDRDRAIAEAVRLRSESKYFDTWVYSGALGKLQLAQKKGITGTDINPLTGARIASIPSDNREQPAGAHAETFPPREVDEADHTTPLARSNTTATARTEVAAPAQESPVAGKTTAAVSSAPAIPTLAEDDAHPRIDDSVVADITNNHVTSAVPIPAPKRVSDAPLQSADVTGRNFYFYLYRGDNGNTIGGEVDAIDFARSRKMATYPANESVSIHIPSGESKRISFICQVFGYRKQQKEYDPGALAEDFYLDDKGNIVVPFELMRLQKGDIAIMYNVFFFKDAAVMRPESRYEVNNLLELLQENPSYKIRIHGHTNGNASGRIIRMNTPGNFYSLTGTKEGFGSAKKLSEERAEVIREFLVHSGIAAERMQIKAWGGKKPLHDPRSARAVENVRVEIEILSE